MNSRFEDQSKTPERSHDGASRGANVVREARPVPPGMVLWSEELEARRLAVARWRGTSGCGERPQHLS